jgi:putative membrane protein
MKKIILMLVVFSTLTAYQTQAQKLNPDTSTVNFVTKAMTGNLTEVNSGKLAVKKAKSASIKSFGARMITDHTKANIQLKAIVASKGWKISSPSATLIAPDAMLTNSSGATFDQSYVNMMVKDHKKTVQLFERAAKSSPDANIKAFAVKTLPTLRQHLTSIQAIADKMGIAYEK